MNEPNDLRDIAGNDGERSPSAKECAHAIAGAAAGAVGAVFYGLAFTPVAIYGLIAGILLEILACGLFKTQKKRRPLKWAKACGIACAVLLALGAAFMAGGVIWAALQEG